MSTNEIKISILHKKIRMDTLKQKTKYPFAGLIQYGAKANGEKPICHTAVLFEASNGKWVFESIGSGLRLVDFSEFKNEVKLQNGECFADTIDVISEEYYYNKILPQLQAWIEQNNKYPFKKALLSFCFSENASFKDKLLLKVLKFVTFFIPSKGYFYCTEIMALIIKNVIFVRKNVISNNASKVLAKIQEKGTAKIQPSNFYNISNQVFKII